MDKEYIITNNNFENIFHPFLFKTFPVKKNDYAIIPKFISSDKIENYKFFSTLEKNIPTDSILSGEQINDIFTSDSFFLSVNLQINSLEDTYLKLDELLISNRKIETIDLIVNVIFRVWTKEIDDIAIDKFISFYQKYFLKFYSTTVEYKNIFKQIQKSLEEDQINIHSHIINNILKK